MKPTGRQAGFTLLEVSVSFALFLMVLLALMETAIMVDRSRAIVFQCAAENREMREVCTLLSNEVRGTREDHLVIEEVANGNHQVTFKSPINVFGEETWGVQEHGLMGGVAQENWSVRYTVATGADRRLVRQVIDDIDVIRKTRIVLGGLSLDPEIPGFRFERAGDLWAVTLMLRPDNGLHQDGREISFQLRLRN